MMLVLTRLLGMNARELRRAVPLFLYLFLTPFYGIFPSIVFPPYGGLIAAGSWLIGFPVLRSLLHSSSGTSFRKRHGWVVTPSSGGRWSSSGWGGGYSGGGGGGGGFSGGGGSSGGGGASSSW